MSDDWLIKSQLDTVQNGTRTESTRAASLIADMIGAKRDSAPNKEQEAARMARMSDEEREYRRKWEEHRTEQEARKGIKIAQ